MKMVRFWFPSPHKAASASLVRTSMYSIHLCTFCMCLDMSFCVSVLLTPSYALILQIVRTRTDCTSIIATVDLYIEHCREQYANSHNQIEDCCLFCDTNSCMFISHDKCLFVYWTQYMYVCEYNEYATCICQDPTYISTFHTSMLDPWMQYLRGCPSNPAIDHAPSVGGASFT